MSLPGSTQDSRFASTLAPILQTLPDIAPIPLNSGEPDYYGASWEIADALSIRAPLPSRAAWSHGVTSRAALEKTARRNQCNLVFTESDARFLRMRGFPAQAVGAPFLYARNQQNPTRIPGSLLILPAHTTTHSTLDETASTLPQEVLELSRKASLTLACISGMCVEKGLWTSSFERIGIPWITGAWIFDRHALRRMRILFQLFDYLATNQTGSHLAYAAACGCRIFFTEDLLLLKRADYRQEPLYVQHPELLEGLPEDLDTFRSIIQRVYPTFTTGMDGASEQIEWGKSTLGDAFKRPASEMALLLGWRTDEAVSARYYAPGYLSTSTASDPSPETAPNNLDRAFAEQDARLNPIHWLTIFEESEQALADGDHARALHLTTEIKAARIPIRGVDRIRGLALLGQHQTEAARAALREELHLFPESPDTRERLKQIAPPPPPRKNPVSELDQIHDQIQNFTNLGRPQLQSLYELTKAICAEDVPGHFVECGVGAGGSVALMAYLIKHYSRRPRQIFCFDSFNGMPEPTDLDRHLPDGQSARIVGWGAGTCHAPQRNLVDLCNSLGVLPVVRPVQGQFHDTLPRWRNIIGEIAFLHLDCRWHDSTQICLDHLYDQIQPGGSIHVSDYGIWQGCRQAIHEFAAERQLNFQLHGIGPDRQGVWFQRS
ncbi:TylF/MycF/NovP-related O-methyltransferase [Thiocystis violacea]|uniref:TylF/MycF/NovP-related O-methyltransferase n=1 Tax=Thiocystis violacea TaxID=13725 RepID=UPI001905F5F5|nr:TylF/MycF/NovP-related O-methyltransferase [Thiocystis violacea]MBK1719498.1 hypothetical protein [Thiocystis violacea]